MTKDITFCTNFDCKRKKTCNRYLDKTTKMPNANITFINKCKNYELYWSKK